MYCFMLYIELNHLSKLFCRPKLNLCTGYKQKHSYYIYVDKNKRYVLNHSVLSRMVDLSYSYSILSVAYTPSLVTIELLKTQS